MGCCNHHENHDHKIKNHKHDCFCGKFLRRFIGQEVDLVLTSGGEPFTATIACYDEETGIVTLVVEGALSYICCTRIEQIIVDTAA